MFRQFESAVKLTALFLLLGLGGWSWFQSQKISSLKAENHAQAQTISQYEQEINRTLNALEQERKAVETLQAMETAQNEKANEDVNEIKARLVVQDCSRMDLPDDVIKRLR